MQTLELQKTEKKVNVATKSTSGHYVEEHIQVVCLDEVKEAYVVEGDAILTTKNHKDLPMLDGCLIMPQKVYNPYSKSLERSRD